VQVLHGVLLRAHPGSEAWRGRLVQRVFRGAAEEDRLMDAGALADAVRWPCSAAPSAWATPFLFVSLGECLTEKSGRINLGLEGVLVLSARWPRFGAAYLSGSRVAGRGWRPAAGACCAAAARAAISSLPRVNDIATGIARDALRHRPGLLPGQAARSSRRRRSIPAHAARRLERLAGGAAAALQVNAAVPAGHRRWRCCMAWGLRTHALGPARAHGGRLRRRGARAGHLGRSACASLPPPPAASSRAWAGPRLSLYYPGSWNEGLSSGQGLIAVALVIFARWHPLRCLGAALLFGGAGALGPALQSVGVDRRLLPLQRRALRAHAGHSRRGTCSPRRALQGARWSPR
jgi:simple sugar transport system permease protein